MASFSTDQAEGLRRMLAGSKPRVVSLVSALGAEEKSGTLVNLAASLTRTGSNVLLLDACSASNGLANRLGAACAATLMQVARQERGLNEVVQTLAQGFGVATLARENLRSAMQDVDQARRLSNTFGVLASQHDIVLVDAELDGADSFVLPAMQRGEIVVQVSSSGSSITAAYAIIKRLSAQLGRRPFGILVTGASERDAQQVFANMAQAASRYLALELIAIGSVPADADLKRAAQLGRSVIDAFPMALASVAFRRLAGHFANGDAGSMRMTEFA
ncbi:antiactivator of flagellar biosynthesis FleN protein [Actimicrobium sp. CCI2.3]|uniref:MinD/ParA family ATP-binding protein n=1 Tax=Actimicrobium sp. CCI2.3 TaxID=3048616 RepID=UPI002AB3603B|nr:antiactivator of flagellar biosynthesis FleN protein [Actimicrobium sp. CCI2.3]MDY7575323.1 antiactivator of flagellar biosynthesis FleN protein [Actimicrobium sp. CCI2.3]MEB0023671.1 antiactivator of flagellar biosynthesis FleN protein [Actimicrobium sp. CCI2.3]